MKCYNFCCSRLELRVIYSNYPNLTSETVNWHYGGLCSAYDNIRHSSIIDVLLLLKQKGVEVIIYEPLIEENVFENIQVEKDIKSFKERSYLIITNRYDETLDDVKEKVYTRDIFRMN